MISEMESFLRSTNVEIKNLHTSSEATQGQKTSKKGSSNKKRCYMENAERAKVANRRAQQIFMEVINSTNTEAEIKLKLRFITREHLDDISVERSLSEICGYPLCTKVWRDEFDQRLYIIRRNKVYDIKTRKLFCSNRCFHAFNIVRSQIPESPLFLRSESDPEFSNFQISFPDVSKLAGMYGTLVEITDHSFLDDDLITAGDHDYLREMESTNVSESGEEEGIPCSSDQSLENSGMEEISKQMGNAYIDSNTVRQDGKHLQNGNEFYTTQGPMKKSEISNFGNVMTVEKCLRETMSFETLKLMLGEIYLRGMMEHIGKNFDDYSDDKGLHGSMKAASGDDGRPQHQLPNYEQQKDNIENMPIKAKSIPVTENEEFSKGQENVLSLPFIDAYSIHQWRRKIFFDKLNKYLPRHVKEMNLNEKRIVDILKPVIYSLELSPHNIYFTPPQWSLLCISFLKLLSIRYEVVAQSFVNDGRTHVESIMSLFGLDNLYLQRLLSYLTELNYILEKTTQK